jgi:hypothetical protein
MKKILFSAQIILFAAALPLYAYFELSQDADTSERVNALQSTAVAITPAPSPVAVHTVKYPGKISKAIVKPTAKATETIAKIDMSKPAVQEKQTAEINSTVEEAMTPQYPEWSISPAKMTGYINESEMTAKIMQELKAAFGKEFQTAIQKLKIRKMECENKKKVCTCISL